PARLQPHSHADGTGTASRSPWSPCPVRHREQAARDGTPRSARSLAERQEGMLPGAEALLRQALVPEMPRYAGLPGCRPPAGNGMDTMRGCRHERRRAG
ncbi:MAG TPA: hypothetical protein VH136_11735, partial [Trebonia sp.]|nr:hypothetical protein [Trebonia sp.]